MGFPGGSHGKESACSAGDQGSIPGSGRSPREGHGNPLQYSFLESSIDGELGGLQSMGSQRVDMTEQLTHTHTHTHTHIHRLILAVVLFGSVQQIQLLRYFPVPSFALTTRLNNVSHHHGKKNHCCGSSLLISSWILCSSVLLGKKYISQINEEYIVQKWSVLTSGIFM